MDKREALLDSMLVSIESKKCTSRVVGYEWQRFTHWDITVYCGCNSFNYSTALISNCKPELADVFHSLVSDMKLVKKHQNLFDLGQSLGYDMADENDRETAKAVMRSCNEAMFNMYNFFSENELGLLEQIFENNPLQS